MRDILMGSQVVESELHRENRSTELAMSTSPKQAPLHISGAIPSYVFESSGDMASHVAQVVAKVIRERNQQGQKAVLGLPTGSTPVDVYRELARLHNEEGLDFSNVVTFNLDEYYGLPHDQMQSYHSWMHTHFFSLVNIPKEHINIPDGMVALNDLEQHCRDYEDKIVAEGGIDIMLLGIGTNGHVGFNEPFSVRNSRTRLCVLDPVTRRAAASDFFGEDNVSNSRNHDGFGNDLKRSQNIPVGDGRAQVAGYSVGGRGRCDCASACELFARAQRRRCIAR